MLSARFFVYKDEDFLLIFFAFLIILFILYLLSVSWLYLGVPHSCLTGDIRASGPVTTLFREDILSKTSDPVLVLILLTSLLFPCGLAPVKTPKYSYVCQLPSLMFH